MEPTCAPDDGPAVRLVVGAGQDACDAGFEEVAHVRITLWDGADWPLAPGSYPFESGTASAWYAPTDGAPAQSGRAGELVVSTSDAGGVAGTYRLELDDGGVVEGTFEATACEAATMCG